MVGSRRLMTFALCMNDFYFANWTRRAKDREYRARPKIKCEVFEGIFPYTRLQIVLPFLKGFRSLSFPPQLCLNRKRPRIFKNQITHGKNSHRYQSLQNSLFHWLLTHIKPNLWPRGITKTDQMRRYLWRGIISQSIKSQWNQILIFPYWPTRLSDFWSRNIT